MKNVASLLHPIRQASAVVLKLIQNLHNAPLLFEVRTCSRAADQSIVFLSQLQGVSYSTSTGTATPGTDIDPEAVFFKPCLLFTSRPNELFLALGTGEVGIDIPPAWRNRPVLNIWVPSYSSRIFQTMSPRKEPSGHFPRILFSKGFADLCIRHG